MSILGPFHEIFNAFKNQDLGQKLETRNRMPAPFFVPAILNEIFLERGILEDSCINHQSERKSTYSTRKSSLR